MLCSGSKQARRDERDERFKRELVTDMMLVFKEIAQGVVTQSENRANAICEANASKQVDNWTQTSPREPKKEGIKKKKVPKENRVAGAARPGAASRAK